MANLIGWIATAIMVWGSIDIAHKHIRGLWLMFIGNVAWTVAGYMVGLYSLVGVSILMGALDLYGVYRWKD